jgi:hypothetical protein
MVVVPAVGGAVHGLAGTNVIEPVKNLGLLVYP